MDIQVIEFIQYLRNCDVSHSIKQVFSTVQEQEFGIQGFV